MRRPASIAVLLVALASTDAGFALAQRSVSAADAWVKATSANETDTVAFAAIENPTMYDVYVVSVASAAARLVEIREGGAGGGEVRVIKELTVPAFGRVDMAPDGVHMRLGSLTRQLAKGDVITLALTFDSGVTLEVSAVVR
ncbi:MAG: copper chaperone PCu(A)C [Acidobacteriota bacterium]